MKVNCPTCQTEVLWQSNNEYRPFCSKKCQLIDLGEWANEEKAIPVKSSMQDEPPGHIDPEDIEAMLAQQEQDFFKS